MTSKAYPSVRMRRMRRDAFSRAMVRENSLSAANLIWPVFVIEGENRTQVVPSMPGVERVSIDVLVARAKEAAALGVGAIALFPVIEADEVDLAAGVFRLNGTVVRVGPTTTFEGSRENLRSGTKVEVSGTVVAGELVASKVEVQAPSA